MPQLEVLGGFLGRLPSNAAKRQAGNQSCSALAHHPYSNAVVNEGMVKRNYSMYLMKVTKVTAVLS